MKKLLISIVLVFFSTSVYADSFLKLSHQEFVNDMKFFAEDPAMLNFMDEILSQKGDNIAIDGFQKWDTWGYYGVVRVNYRLHYRITLDIKTDIKETRIGMRCYGVVKVGPGNQYVAENGGSLEDYANSVKSGSKTRQDFVLTKSAQARRGNCEHWPLNSDGTPGEVVE